MIKKNFNKFLNFNNNKYKDLIKINIYINRKI